MRALAQVRRRLAPYYGRRPGEGRLNGRKNHPSRPVHDPRRDRSGARDALQQHGAQRGRQRERIERGDDGRDGDGDGELLVELAGQAADERGGNEHRAQHQRDGDDRSGDLVHRLAVASTGETAERDVPLHVLDHHDGVVDHDADGEHEPEQGEHVDAEPERQHHANVPTSETGTAASGMMEARQVCRNRMTTMTTSRMASKSVVTTAL
jgi:hypothetical protein